MCMDQVSTTVSEIILISNFYIDSSLWTLKSLSPKLPKPKQNPRVTCEKVLYVEMTGQHPHSWTDTQTLSKVAKAWRTMVAAPTWALLFCELMVWCWAWWPVPAWQGREPSVAQEGVTDLPQCLRALCDLGDSKNLQRAVFGQSYGAGDSWAEQGGLRSLFVLLKSQRRVQNAHSRVLSKISWGRDHPYKMLNGAEWSSCLWWGCSHKPNLRNNSLGYEFIGVCDWCWTEMLSPFLWLVSSPMTERTARARHSKISFLTTGY